MRKFFRTFYRNDTANLSRNFQLQSLRLIPDLPPCKYVCYKTEKILARNKCNMFVLKRLLPPKCGKEVLPANTNLRLSQLRWASSVFSSKPFLPKKSQSQWSLSGSYQAEDRKKHALFYRVSQKKVLRFES